jgi:magnesium chelatase family protein
VFPARFLLVGTMNLCPCGARGDPAVECTCTPQKLAAYGAKLSRALVDRFDLVVHMPRPRGRELDARPAEASRFVRARVEPAAERLARKRPRLGADARELLTRAVDTLPLSARGRARVARVAATVAALAADEEIGAAHVAEALSYRAPRELAA